MKRYDPTIECDPYVNDEYVAMEEDKCGEYVKYEDVQKLLKITEDQLIADHNARCGWRGCVKFIREVMGG